MSKLSKEKKRIILLTFIEELINFVSALDNGVNQDCFEKLVYAYMVQPIVRYYKSPNYKKFFMLLPLPISTLLLSNNLIMKIAGELAGELYNLIVLGSRIWDCPDFIKYKNYFLAKKNSDDYDFYAGEIFIGYRRAKLIYLLTKKI